MVFYGIKKILEWNWFQIRAGNEPKFFGRPSPAREQLLTVPARSARIGQLISKL